MFFQRHPRLKHLVQVRTIHVDVYVKHTGYGLHQNMSSDILRFMMPPGPIYISEQGGMNADVPEKGNSAGNGG